MLRSLQQFPPDGWKFYQPEINWNSDPHRDFNNVVQQIITVRSANPRFALSVDREQVAAQLVAYTEHRLRAQYGAGADQWIMPGGEGSPPPPFSTPRRSRAVVAVAGEAKKESKVSLGTILLWLGDGLKPVDQATAEARAGICVGCDRNVRSEGILKALSTVGDTLHAIAEAKTGMELKTPFDDRLQSCSACGCVLATKIWTPMDHILKGITPAVKEKLWDQCWIKIPLTQKA